MSKMDVKLYISPPPPYGFIIRKTKNTFASVLEHKLVLIFFC